MDLVVYMICVAVLAVVLITYIVTKKDVISHIIEVEIIDHIKIRTETKFCEKK